jgi:fatty acid desaturase
VAAANLRATDDLEAPSVYTSSPLSQTGAHMTASDPAPTLGTRDRDDGRRSDRPATSRAGRGSAYAELSRQVRQAGLLDRRPGWYAARIGLNAVMLAAGWTALFLLRDSWWQLATAVWLAVVFAQTAFLGHDAGHRQIFRRRRPNDLIGLVHGNLLIGLSYGWWVGKHNRHHSNPNHEDLDPDVIIGTVAFTADQARARHGLTRVMARYQAWLFFPLLTLEAVHLHGASVKAVLRNTVRSRSLEALLLLAHLAGYLTALLLVLSPVRAAVFVVVQQGLFGLYLGCAFAPNHKGMPMLTEADELDYLRRQVLTARNVRGNRVVDVVLGGLNYQIEHHLFPNMPRPNLRRSRPLIRAFCLQHGLTYHESTMLGSYAQALRHLHAVGAPLRPAPTD